MAKGFDTPFWFVETLFSFTLTQGAASMKTLKTKENRTLQPESPIAYRKACRADGVGLSHYILVQPERKPA